MRRRVRVVVLLAVLGAVVAASAWLRIVGLRPENARNRVRAPAGRWPHAFGVEARRAQPPSTG